MNLERLGNALIGKLMNLGPQQKYRIAVHAGLDLSEVSPEDAKYNVPVNNAIMRAFGKQSLEAVMQDCGAYARYSISSLADSRC